MVDSDVGDDARRRAEADADADADPIGLAWVHERSETLQETRIFDLCRRWARAPDEAIEDFYVLEMPDWVQILPLLPDGRFLMVEQFRHGTQRVTLEFPAGIIEPGESALECAIRELEEETGYTAGSAEVIGRVDANAALQDNELFMVVLRDCRADGAMHPDPRERIRPRIVDPEDVDRFIENGDFREAYGIIAWDFYRRHLANKD